METLKVEKRIFDCDLCNSLLVDPIILPCSNTICQLHINDLLEKRSKRKNAFICELCVDEHDVPANGFASNKRIKHQLDTKRNEMKIESGINNRICKKSVNEAENSLAKLELVHKDPENYIYEYFEDIKREVDLRREVLKDKIDSYSEEIIESIESTKLNLISISKEVDQLTFDVTSLKKELSEIKEKFVTFELDDGICASIKKSIDHLKIKCDEILVDYKESLLRNTKYSFTFKDQSLVEDFFGKFWDDNRLFESKIIELDQQKQLVKLCKFPRDEKWKLLYRASEDGFDTTDFHLKCDGFKNTLTVIKSTKGNIFGGFAEKAWHSNGASVTDPKAFIFSMVNKKKNLFKVMCSSGGNRAINCYSHLGPSFGSDGQFFRDIVLYGNSNVNNESFSNFGYSYQHPSYPKETFVATSILAGSFNFRTLEIEVFIKNKDHSF